MIPRASKKTFVKATFDGLVKTPFKVDSLTSSPPNLKSQHNSKLNASWHYSSETAALYLVNRGQGFSINVTGPTLDVKAVMTTLEAFSLLTDFAEKSQLIGLQDQLARVKREKEAVLVRRNQECHELEVILRKNAVQLETRLARLKTFVKHFKLGLITFDENRTVTVENPEYFQTELRANAAGLNRSPEEFAHSLAQKAAADLPAIGNAALQRLGSPSPARPRRHVL